MHIKDYLLRLLCDVLLHFDYEFIVIDAGIHQFGEGVRRHRRSLQEALVSASRVDVGSQSARCSGSGLVGDACQPGKLPDDETPGAWLELQTV
jgi:hypothetical protein